MHAVGVFQMFTVAEIAGRRPAHALFDAGAHSHIAEGANPLSKRLPAFGGLVEADFMRLYPHNDIVAYRLR